MHANTIPVLVEELNRCRHLTAMEAGLGAVVTDARIPYFAMYVTDMRAVFLVRARWAYPAPDRRGRIPGLTLRQAGNVASRRIVEAGVARVSKRDPAGVITAWADRIATQLKPHELTDRAPSRTVAKAWRGLVDDMRDGLDDEVTRDDRTTIALALAGRVGPALVAAMAADAADGGRRTESVRAGAKPDAAAVGSARIADPAGLADAMRVLGGCIALIPDWRIASLGMRRRDWTAPLDIIRHRLTAAA